MPRKFQPPNMRLSSLGTPGPLNIRMGLPGAGSPSAHRTGQFAQSAMRDSRRILENFQAFVNHMEEAQPEVLYEAMVPAFELSQTLVPVESGLLKSTGYLEIERRAQGARVNIGYAKGGHPWYAIMQHEDLELSHEPPQQAKFLQDAIAFQRDQIKQDIINGNKQAAGTEGDVGSAPLTFRGYG